MQIVGNIILGIGIFLIGLSIGMFITLYILEIKDFDKESSNADSN